LYFADIYTNCKILAFLLPCGVEMCYISLVLSIF